jgi:ribose transport system permease protein
LPSRCGSPTTHAKNGVTLSSAALRRRLQKPWVGQLVGLAPYALVPALFVIGAVTIQGYASVSSVKSLLVLASLLGLATVGQTLAVIVGGVDLSIPATIGLADVMITQLYGYHWSFWLAFLLILGLAVAIGTANALISRGLQVHPLVITLGTGLIVTGGVLTWSHSALTGTVPGWLVNAVTAIGKTGPIPVPAVVLLWLVVSVLTIAFQRLTRLGRELYASGANPVAARLALVRTTWVWVVVFVISAVFAAVTGVLYAGFSGSGDVSVGDPYLFETLTAVVVGGTSLLGGRGGYGRSVVGVLTITQLTTLLVGIGFGSSMQEALLGVLVVILVGIYGREPHVSARL